MGLDESTNYIFSCVPTRVVTTMGRTTFDADDDIEDHVPDGCSVELVKYNGSRQTVEYDEGGVDESSDFEGMSRSELYSLGKDNGVDLCWSGGDADSRDEMVRKLEESSNIESTQL